MFKKILIANRGEIACRVIATAKRMGIQTVAVYSEADKGARHVQLADEAVFIGPAPSRDSYLVADKIIAACKATGAQAIHPGYGFLSENQVFAKRCEDEGIVFIGPRSQSIAAMGDKIESKKLATKAGVNTIPGVNEAISSAEKAVEIAKGIGYPVMIKASAGGGGKGLRVAYNDQETLEGFTSCTNEAKNSFGDDRVFIEKFVEDPRHIEIQVLGDSHGHVIYLNERECSIQRRHQKVIEEAPSPFISEQTRLKMGEQAVALAQAVNYRSAGTVEFVVGRDQSFYFLEMNTRLQVEHPVTECITGLDLVEWMIRIAFGEHLTLKQNDVKKNGWAMECRINAEDPLRNFLPSTGRLVHFQPPPQTMFQGDTSQSLGVRVDTGVCEGGEIPMHYDSMIAKLIVHGADRFDAIAKMQDALNGFVIRGVHSNIAFQSALLSHPDFVNGQFNTGFIAEHYPGGFTNNSCIHPDPHFLVALAAFVRRKSRERATNLTGQLPGYDVKIGESYVVIELSTSGGHNYWGVEVEESGDNQGMAVIRVEGKSYAIQSSSRLSAIKVEGTSNGRPFAAQVDRGSDKNPLSLEISHSGRSLSALVVSPRMADLYKLMPFKAPPDLSRFVLSPMPGLLADVLVKPGQKVQIGERVAVIEAMKMENVLVAGQNGTVKAVLATKGESLTVDQLIVEFEKS
jgi:propionyl-CoA carboxylase alpha chain